MNPDLLVVELERILGQVNGLLKKVLPHAKTYADAKTVKAIQEAERLSRVTHFDTVADMEKSAEIKAKEYGAPFVIADNGWMIVSIPKARFLKDKPFGMTRKDIVFETGKTGKETKA